MELVAIYQCLCEPARLRILNLLLQGPLCVCHLQEVLNEPQVKISKHLGYLKAHGLVGVKKEANWRIYNIADEPTKALEANLACLQDCAAEDKTFRRDLERLKVLRSNFEGGTPSCCAKPRAVKLKST